MIPLSTTLVAGLLAAGPTASGPLGAGPCLKLQRAGTQIQGEVKVCPGRYRIPDPREVGVIIVASSGGRVDLSGVTLESGDSVSGRFVGKGVVVQGVDSATVRGGLVRGYRYGVWIEGGKGHRISGMDLSGSRNQEPRPAAGPGDTGYRLELFDPDTFETYGGGLFLKRTEGVLVTGVTARGAQNGIGLSETRSSIISDNDVSANSGWGIHLWRSSGNVLVRNRVDHVTRCASALENDCAAVAVLIRDRSDSNLVMDNDLTWSATGLALLGKDSLESEPVGNLAARNDASHALHAAFEASFAVGTTFLENQADSSEYGFRLGHVSQSRLRHNTIIGSRAAGIFVDHGDDIELGANVIIGGRVGIHLRAPEENGRLGQGYRVDDNTLARTRVGLVLEHAMQAKVRGNLFEVIDEGIVADEGSTDAEVTGNVFLRARRWFIRAAALNAGGNFWATRDADSAARLVSGAVTILPWKPAVAAGY